MTYTIFRVRLLLIATISTLVAPSIVAAQVPTYRMELIQDDRVSFDEVNNLGLVCGRTATDTANTSFVYDSLGLIADQISGKHYLIEEIVEIPAPWIRFKIRGRNDNGYEIVGWVEDASGDKAAAYIDLSLASTTMKAPLVLLGQNINADVADDINDDGDILVRPEGLNGDLYYVHRDDPANAITLGIENDFGVVNGTPKIGNRLYNNSGALVRNAIVSAKLVMAEPEGRIFRYVLWSPISNLEILDSETFNSRDMSNDGLLCGSERIEVPTGRGKKTKVVDEIGVFGSEFLSLNDDGHADGINNFGDVVGDNWGRALVFFGNPGSGYQSHLIQDLLEHGPDKDFVQGKVQRSHKINDFGQITLKCDGRYYLLTPIDPGNVTTYSSGNINLPITDNNPVGRSHTIEVESGEEVTIVKLTVAVNINHPRPSDLTVTLTGPDGTVVSINNLNGEIVTEFNGNSTLGLWTINAVDSRKKKTGTINSWSITAQY